MKKTEPFFQWLSGILATIISGVLIFWITQGHLPWVKEKYNANNETETTIANDEERKIFQSGTLSIGLNQAVDLDGNNIISTETSLSTKDADILIRHATHGFVIEPGVPKGDGITFNAKFLNVSDRPSNFEGCSAAAISSNISNHLQLFSDIHIGSYICVLTTQKRIAEIELLKFDDVNGNLPIKYKVWERNF